MIRPLYFFLLLCACCLLLSSWSLAQQEQGQDPPIQEEQTSTGLDTDETPPLFPPGDEESNVSGDIQTGSSTTQVDAEFIMFQNTGSGETTGDSEEMLLPQLLISELFFDGSDERLEISNLGSQDFSGVVSLSGIGINTSLSLSMASGAVLVIGRAGRTFPYIIDTSVISHYAPMGFTDTKEVSISLWRSGYVIDHFYADTGVVVHYNDKKTSLERYLDNGFYLITGTSIARQLNVLPPYIANPGSFDIIILDFGDTGTGTLDDLSGAANDCQYLSASPLLQLSELFWGNEQRDSYIEILALQDVDLGSIIFSGSLLGHPLELSMPAGSGLVHKGQRIIISSGHKRSNEPILHLDNQELSVSESGGLLQIWQGSGQSGQVLDIALVPSRKPGSSSYFQGNTFSCIRKMDLRGWFSPGFDEGFLKYFIGSTGYKIMCSAPVTTSPSQGQAPVSNNNTTTGELIPSSGTWMSGNIWSIAIADIDYDPPGSDINNETITILAQLPLGEPFLVLGKPDRYIKIGTTKRYLSGTLLPNIPLSIKGSFAFPNSSKSGAEITVQLWYQNQLLDVYSYLPGSSSATTTTLTGTFLVTTVVDGDTFKIAYKTGQQSIRMLGLDAPEVSLLRTKKKGCLADESKTYLESLLLGKEVRLEYDSTQKKADSYKRWLNYVYLDDLLINEEMISAGYAKEYTFKVPYLMRTRFLLAQAQAQEDQLGLWNTIHCPENALTGKQMTGEDMQLFSGGEAKILWIIPNPKGKDDKEQLAIRVKRGELETGRNVLSGFSLLINGKKKKIKEAIPLNEETILSGSFGLPNKAACVSILFQSTLLDTICYSQPKEGEIIYADGSKNFLLTDEEQTLLASLVLKKIGNKMCAFYGGMQIDCNNIPSGKTALKIKQEHKMYRNFVNILQPYLKKHWSNIFYDTKIYPYFTLLRAAKKNISAGMQTIPTSHGPVGVYDLAEQLRIIETFSLGYWAKRFGQVLLNEI